MCLIRVLKMNESDKMIKGEKYLWTSEKTKLLIKKTECYPELWNTKVKDFKNKIKKQNALKNLAAGFGTSEEEIRRKLHNLRTQLGQEVNKARKRKSGQSTDDTYSSKWEFYNAMKFMLCSYVPKDNQDNLSFQARAESEKNENEPTCKSVKSDILTEPVNIQNRRKKRKTKENNPTDVILQSALQVLLQKTSDEHQIFGDYIASELRGFKNDLSRKKLKQLIQMSILQVSEEDENPNNQYTDST